MELDHLFIMCAAGAPESDALARLGLKEGSANSHPQQGTACRRFFFRQTYLELLWVHDPHEARSDLVRPTRLWDRWAMRRAGACPFGIVLRAGSDAGAPAPFPTWPYAPSYLPEGLAIDVAQDTPLTEPAFFHLGFQRNRPRIGQEPIDHAIPTADLTGVQIGLPAPGAGSAAARALERSGVLEFVPSSEYILQLTFDGGRSGRSADLRPELPVVLGW